MTNRELASLAIKLLGVYCLIQVVGSAPSLSFWLGVKQETLSPLLFGCAVLGLYTVLGVALIWKSDWCAGLMVRTAQQPPPERERVDGLQEVLFSVVGVVLVVHALPTILFAVIRHFQTEDWETGTSGFQRAWPHLAVSSVQIVAGVALFLGSPGLARVWRRITEMNQRP